MQPSSTLKSYFKVLTIFSRSLSFRLFPGILFLLISFSVVAGPYTGTESLRSNLYLLNTSNNTTILADGVLTEYNDVYHDAITLEDAYKFTNITENLGMTRYGTTLSVERRPIIVSTDTVYFKLWKTTQRFYQLEFVATNLNHPGMQAVLQDSYLGTNTPVLLTGTTKVTFSVNSNAASSNVSRFKIIYSTVIMPAPLPVTFTSIKGTPQKSKVSINWTVENEINMSGYEPEHSIDGKNFDRISSLDVLSLNSLSNSYTYLHESPVNGNNFYRLRSVDKDGTYKFSPVIKVEINNLNKGALSVYPNPLRGNIANLEFSNQPSGVYTILLRSSTGQLVSSKKVVINSINNVQTLNLPLQVKAGIYQVEVQMPGTTTQIKKLIIQ
jgi:hypothetical protein